MVAQGCPHVRALRVYTPEYSRECLSFLRGSRINSAGPSLVRRLEETAAGPLLRLFFLLPSSSPSLFFSVSSFGSEYSPLLARRVHYAGVHAATGEFKFRREKRRTGGRVYLFHSSRMEMSSTSTEAASISQRGRGRFRSRRGLGANAMDTENGFA